MSVPALRFPEFEGEWKENSIRGLATKITDGTHDTPKPTQSGIPYLTAIHVKDGFIDFDSCYYLSAFDHEKIFARCNPEFGDLLMVNIGAGTATVASVNVDFEFSLKNVALVKPDRARVDPGFLFQAQSMNSARLRHQLTAGGAQPFFSLKQIGKLKLKVPSLPEQKKIAAFLGVVDAKIAALRARVAGLTRYKRGLMQALFSQTLRFTKPDGTAFPDWEEKRLGEVSEIYQPQTISQTDLVSEGYTVYGANGIIGRYSKYNHEHEQVTVTCRGNTCGTVGFTEPY